MVSKMRKRLLISALLLIFVIALAPAASERDLDVHRHRTLDSVELVKDGVLLYDIVYPDNASSKIQRAYEKNRGGIQSLTGSNRLSCGSDADEARKANLRRRDRYRHRRGNNFRGKLQLLRISFKNDDIYIVSISENAVFEGAFIFPCC
jgi:hypothetical protein